MSLGITIGIGISACHTIRIIGMPAGECLTAIPIGAIRIGDILGTVIITTIIIRATTKVITDIITVVTAEAVSTDIMQWIITEYIP